MLFIHGDGDTYVPVKMVEQLYKVKPEPKELWIVPGATHAHSYKSAPKEYTKRLTSTGDSDTYLCRWKLYVPEDCVIEKKNLSV